MDQRHVRLMTVREVADALALHVNSVKRVPAKALPFYRVCKRGDRRYQPADVAAYLAKTTAGYR